jgi:hypothetical protein
MGGERERFAGHERRLRFVVSVQNQQSKKGNRQTAVHEFWYHGSEPSAKNGLILRQNQLS